MLEEFDEKNIDAIVQRVLPLWHVDGADEDFNRKYVEMIIRTNMHQNHMQFQLCQNQQLCAIAFAAQKGDVSSTTWLEKQLSLLGEQERFTFKTGRQYLLMMEEKTFALMSEKDVKLCLFVSLRKGFGSKILDMVTQKLKAAGYQNIYLWTDGECNVQWYFDNQFQLVQQEEYIPFSRPGQPYMTYIFKKSLM